MSSSDKAGRESNIALLKSVFEKMSSGRSAETVDDITDDFAFELPYGPGCKALNITGKDQWKMLNEMTWGGFARFALEITKVYEMLNPDELILEYRSDGEVAATGKPYKNRYIGYFKFQDGLIREWKEFHNPEIASRAMTADA